MSTFIHLNGCLLVYLMCPLASWNTPSSLEGDEGRRHPCCGWELHPHENSKSNSFFISAQTKIVPSLSLALSEYKKASPQSDLYYLDSFRHLLLHKITPQQWLETITITYLAYKPGGQLGSAGPFSLEVFHTVAAHLWLELRSDWGHLESFWLKFSAWAGEIQTPACWNSWGSSGISPPLLPLPPPLPFLPPLPPPSLTFLFSPGDWRLKERAGGNWISFEDLTNYTPACSTRGDCHRAQVQLEARKETPLLDMEPTRFWEAPIQDGKRSCGYLCKWPSAPRLAWHTYTPQRTHAHTQ